MINVIGVINFLAILVSYLKVETLIKKLKQFFFFFLIIIKFRKFLYSINL